MIEGEVVHRSTILTGEPVSEKDVEPRKRGIKRRPHIAFQRDDTRQLNLQGRAADRTIIFRHDVHAIEKNSLHRILPAPKRQRIVTERPIIGVQHQRWKIIERRSRNIHSTFPVSIPPPDPGRGT